MTTALFTHPDSLTHLNPPGHPERVARIEAIAEVLDGPDFAALDRREAPLCTEDDILLAHPRRHLDSIVGAAPTTGYVQLDMDTSMSPGTLNAARRAVGGCIAAVDAVLAGDVTNAFVACRPPGHHAETSTAMGFCYFGSVAIAALHAAERHGLTRVAVVDFDVHHGNGTQDILWDETRTLFCSSHQMPLFPGTGHPDETGAHGNVLNTRLAPMTGSAEMRAAYSDRILPAVEDYAPELIVVSAGFDAHTADPLAHLNWTTEDFGWLSAEIVALAGRVCEGRVVSSLEGGYHLGALADSVAAHVRALMEA